MAKAQQGMQVKACSQQDEQAGYQQHTEVFLEVQDLPHINPAHVGQPHAHHGHRQQPGLVHDLVGGDENAQYRRQ
ncbi:hypothetical protein D9M73_165310 [compost metagenome]